MEESFLPFSALDEWCEGNEYPTDNQVENSLEYVKAIKDGRIDKEIPAHYNI